MAIARKLSPPPAPPPTYMLELSKEEAQFLFDLLVFAVDGSYTKSRRAHSVHISEALGEAGITYSDRGDLEGEVDIKDSKRV